MTDTTPGTVMAGGDMRARHAPATLRNRVPIAHVLATVLPTSGIVLEVASGSGEHCAFFAEQFPRLSWQPSDPEPAARASIAAWCAGVANVRPPVDLDAGSTDWPFDGAAAVLCINMVHISPWEATLGLLAGAARLLPPGGPVFLYGPYRRTDQPTSPSNEAFDASLKARDPRWGLRDLDEVVAAANQFVLDRVVDMPANNLSVILRRREPRLAASVGNSVVRDYAYEAGKTQFQPFNAAQALPKSGPWFRCFLSGCNWAGSGQAAFGWVSVKAAIAQLTLNQRQEVGRQRTGGFRLGIRQSCHCAADS